MGPFPHKGTCDASVSLWKLSSFSTVPVIARGQTTLLKVPHSGVPEGETSHEKGGWQTHYFELMKKSHMAHRASHLRKLSSIHRSTLRSCGLQFLAVTLIVNRYLAAGIGAALT